ncbi:MAG: SOS response-associated peptidase [Clostridia bacterium]|nr:SOS response-associated peptidase [Clostridia bacterium]
MCGRYYLEESPELRPIIEAMNRSPLLPRFQNATAITRAGEVSPSCIVPVIATNKAGILSVFPMKWGFANPRTGGLLINARSETASTKPTFREAWESHRCIVPASYYFEWEHVGDATGKKSTGHKYMIQPAGQTTAWLCGLYRLEQGLPSFVILTREPGEAIRFIHDRMPLMLPREQVDEWIKPENYPAEIVRAAQTEMFYERAAG